MAAAWDLVAGDGHTAAEDERAAVLLARGASVRQETGVAAQTIGVRLAGQRVFAEPAAAGRADVAVPDVAPGANRGAGDARPDALAVLDAAGGPAERARVEVAVVLEAGAALVDRAVARRAAGRAAFAAGVIGAHGRVQVLPEHIADFAADAVGLDHAGRLASAVLEVATPAAGVGQSASLEQAVQGQVPQEGTQTSVLSTLPGTKAEGQEPPVSSGRQ